MCSEGPLLRRSDTLSLRTCCTPLHGRACMTSPSNKGSHMDVSGYGNIQNRVGRELPPRKRDYDERQFISMSRLRASSWRDALKLDKSTAAPHMANLKQTFCILPTDGHHIAISYECLRLGKGIQALAPFVRVKSICQSLGQLGSLGQGMEVCQRLKTIP